MGTNYYAEGAQTCRECGGTGRSSVHLGKSSAGWKFILQWNGGTFYGSWDEMKEWLKDKVISDEYGERISLEEFIERVESKQDRRSHDADYPSEDSMVVNEYEFYDREFS